MGMRKPEQKLWDRLSNLMASSWRADRIENKISQGIPDLYFGISTQLLGWIELKAMPEFPKTATTKVKLPHYTAWQANWHWTRRDFGTRSWIMVQVGDELFTFPARLALALLEGMNTKEFRSAAVIKDMKKATNLDIIDALLQAR